MRRQIGIMFEEETIAVIDEHCKAKKITRTRYIDDAIKAAIRRDGIRIKPLAPPTYWDGDIEDMPA